MLHMRRILASLALCGVLSPAVVIAQSVPAGSITIEQETTSEAIGEWTIIKPGDVQERGLIASKQVENPIPGSYTLIAQAPKGYNTELLLYSGSTIVQQLDVPQVTFTLAEGQQVRVVLRYHLSRVGEISVSSDPPGLPFTLTGPNRFEKEGVTPQGFTNVPEGQYSVTYHSPEGCPQPPLQGLLLKKDEQISFKVTIACDAADRMREELKQRAQSDVNVVVHIAGQPVELTDVPKSAWFASYVEASVKNDIFKGYEDADGNPTGRFGPENAVTIAELATVAHRLAGVDHTAIRGLPLNPQAKGQWFERYVTSAEQRGWTVFLDERVSLTRPATRAEVVVTLLQALDVPLQWQTGTVFTDVTARTAYAAAIETAAAEGLVSGRTDANGEPTGIFSPTDPVNRAEMTKIVHLAIQNYRMD